MSTPSAPAAAAAPVSLAERRAQLAAQLAELESAEAEAFERGDVSAIVADCISRLSAVTHAESAAFIALALTPLVDCHEWLQLAGTLERPPAPVTPTATRGGQGAVSHPYAIGTRLHHGEQTLQVRALASGQPGYHLDANGRMYSTLTAAAAAAATLAGLSPNVSGHAYWKA